jgi:hypothetical protein
LDRPGERPARAGARPGHLVLAVAIWRAGTAGSGPPALSLRGRVAGNGSLYVWRAVNPAETAFGEFVPISQAENTDDVALKTAATARGAFRFARLEDAAVAFQRSGRLYFADTGKAGEATVNGRVYRLDIDPSDPTEASLTLVLDSTVDDASVQAHTMTARQPGPDLTPDSSVGEDGQLDALFVPRS